ncbi:MAG: hypothetical protein WAV16_01585 [Candidatus Moraniibacteriota bacterium]
MEEKGDIKSILAEINKILMVFCLLIIPTIYIGYWFKIKPEIWGVVSAVVCFLVSLAIVKIFFSKKGE